MAKVEISVLTKEWSDSSKAPFDVEEIKIVDLEVYTLNLYSDTGEVTDSFDVPNVKKVTLKGKHEGQISEILLSNSLIEDFDRIEADHFERLVIMLVEDKKVWDVGEGIGMYFDLDQCPEEMKKFDIRLNG